MFIRAILGATGKQYFHHFHPSNRLLSNRSFFGKTPLLSQLMGRISDLFITTLQKRGNLPTVKYPSWKGPQGTVDPKAPEIYTKAYAAETRRKIAALLENNKHNP